MPSDPNRQLVSDAVSAGVLAPPQANVVLKAIKKAEKDGQRFDLREFLIRGHVVSERRWDDFQKSVEKKKAPKEEKPVQEKLPSPAEDAPAVLELPCEIGGYRLTQKIGQGGMGSVFKATQLMMRRTVAIKLLPAQLAEDPAYVERFRIEARAAAALNHPNVVVPIEVGEVNGTHFLSMEFIDGESLGAWMDREGRLPWRDACEIARQVADGLDFAHKRKIVHRDIKPDNILLDRANGMAKIVDMGLAKRAGESAAMSRNGLPVGTPYYASPEQGRGQSDLDGRSDVYSLGATLWHMIVGVPPYDGVNAAVIMTKHITEEIPDPRPSVPECPDEVAAIVFKMMAKEPKDRYASAGLLAEDLDALLKGQPLIHAGARKVRAHSPAGVPALRGGPTVSRARPGLSRPAASRFRNPQGSRLAPQHSRLGGRSNTMLRRARRGSSIPWVAVGVVALVVPLIAAWAYVSARGEAAEPKALPAQEATEKPGPEPLPVAKKTAENPAAVRADQDLRLLAAEALEAAKAFELRARTDPKAVVARFDAVASKFPGTPEADEALRLASPYRVALEALGAPK